MAGERQGEMPINLVNRLRASGVLPPKTPQQLDTPLARRIRHLSPTLKPKTPRPPAA